MKNIFLKYLGEIVALKSKKYLESHRYFEIKKIFGERLGEHNIIFKILKIFFPKYTPHPHKETLCS